jgi:hypothetical protein
MSPRRDNVRRSELDRLLAELEHPLTVHSRARSERHGGGEPGAGISQGTCRVPPPDYRINPTPESAGCNPIAAPKCRKKNLTGGVHRPAMHANGIRVFDIGKSHVASDRERAAKVPYVVWYRRNVS